MRITKGLAVAAGGALALGLTIAAPALAAPASPARTAAPASPASPASPAGSCTLGNAASSIKHVIYIQFDNVHYTRDNPNVPSDLEQMPNLLNFITGNGTLISHEHTPLIAHTADDIVTSETGLYGGNQGMPKPSASSGWIPWPPPPRPWPATPPATPPTRASRTSWSGSAPRGTPWPRRCRRRWSAPSSAGSR